MLVQQTEVNLCLWNLIVVSFMALIHLSGSNSQKVFQGVKKVGQCKGDEEV